MSFGIIYLFSYNTDIYELMCDDSNLQTHFRCQHFHLNMLVHKCPNPKYDKLFLSTFVREKPMPKFSYKLDIFLIDTSFSRK